MSEQLDLQATLWHTCASTGETVQTSKSRPSNEDSTAVWNDVRQWPFKHVPDTVLQATKDSAEAQWNTLWDAKTITERAQTRCNLELLLGMRTSPPPGATEQSTW